MRVRWYYNLGVGTGSHRSVLSDNGERQMTIMTGGQALVRSMQREGIQVVFGIPTAGQYEAVDALWETPEIRYISVRHEQAAAYMADGYARAGGRIAGAIVAPGPGLLNALAAMATAADACSPMLVVSSTWRFDEDAPGDQSWWPMARWTAQLDRPAGVPQVVHEAMRRMKTTLPGPVLLQLTPGTLARIEEVELLEPEEFAPPAAEAGLLQTAAQYLLDAKRPAIWAGGGVHRAGASAALLAVAEHLQAPVITSPAGKGAISDRHPLSLGLGERRYAPLGEWLRQRDVILAVGSKTSFDDRTAGQRVVRIDIDERRFAGDRQHDIGMVADACVSLVALGDALGAAPARIDCSTVSQIAGLLEERFAEHNQLQPQWSYMQAIREAVPDDGVIVQGMNQMGYYSRNYVPMYESRTYLTGSHHGTLGHAYPVGLGAKIARPDAPVVVLEGDGGFLYNSQELATAVQYGLDVVVIVFNDNAYGNPLRSQIEQYDGHVLGTELHNPDFAALARTYGARGFRVAGPEELQKAIGEALAQDAPTLIEVPVGRMERVY